VVCSSKPLPAALSGFQRGGSSASTLLVCAPRTKGEPSAIYAERETDDAFECYPTRAGFLFIREIPFMFVNHASLGNSFVHWLIGSDNLPTGRCLGRRITGLLPINEVQHATIHVESFIQLPEIYREWESDHHIVSLDDW
jgi:hypothetical protein